MMELGVMTPEQGMDLIDTGDFPKSKDLQAAQKTFKQSREDGHYLPLVNSINLYQQDGDINDKSTDSNTADEGRDNVVKNPSPSGGRPVGVSNSTHYSKANIIEVTKMVTEFEKRAVKEFSKKFDIKRLNKDKKDLVSRVCDSIVVAKESESWDSELSNVLGDLEQMNNLEINSEVLDFGAKHQLDDLSAAILYHSTKLID